MCLVLQRTNMFGLVDDQMVYSGHPQQVPDVKEQDRQTNFVKDKIQQRIETYKAAGIFQKTCSELLERSSRPSKRMIFTF